MKNATRDKYVYASAIACMLLCARCACTPAYFSAVANQALHLQGGGKFGQDLSVNAIMHLETQVCKKDKKDAKT